jgi:hypothetical protein
MRLVFPVILLSLSKPLWPPMPTYWEWCRTSPEDGLRHHRSERRHRFVRTTTTDAEEVSHVARAVTLRGHGELPAQTTSATASR